MFWNCMNEDFDEVYNAFQGFDNLEYADKLELIIKFKFKTFFPFFDLNNRTYGSLALELNDAKSLDARRSNGVEIYDWRPTKVGESEIFRNSLHFFSSSRNHRELDLEPFLNIFEPKYWESIQRHRFPYLYLEEELRPFSYNYLSEISYSKGLFLGLNLLGEQSEKRYSIDVPFIHIGKVDYINGELDKWSSFMYSYKTYWRENKSLRKEESEYLSIIEAFRVCLSDYIIGYSRCEYYSFLTKQKQRLDDGQDITKPENEVVEVESTPQPTDKVKLKWNGSNRALYHIFAQFKLMNNGKSGNGSNTLISNSDENIAEFISQSFEGMPRPETILREYQKQKDEDNPEFVSRNKIIIECK